MALDDDTTGTGDGTDGSTSGSGFTTAAGTCCDGVRVNNVWVEGVVDEEGRGGICMLDSMSLTQIIWVLQHDPRARADLKKVTSNPELLALAETVPPLPTANVNDRQMNEINRHKDSIPFYSVFRGKPPTAR